MIIDKTSQLLTPDNYYEKVFDKKQIILANTRYDNMNHMIGFKHRFNGKNKKTAAFTIDAAGFIYQHFDPKYYTDFLGNTKYDIKSIVILIENYGRLLLNENNEYITWNGDIYNKYNGVTTAKWRGYEYWANYNEEQIISTNKLIHHLCDSFSIPKNIENNNVKLENTNNYEGILYRSNINKSHTDLTPAWDFSRFSKLIKQ